MPKRKKLIIVLSCLFGLTILIGIGPIIIASIMKRVSAGHIPSVSPKNEPTKPEADLSKPKESQIMLMVSGEVAVVGEGNTSFIVLTASSGKKYILIGPKAEELRSVSGKKVTVAGIPSKPIPQEIRGESIRMTIEVKTAQIK